LSDRKGSLASTLPPRSERRHPKGYVGQRHETKGACLLAVVRILKLPDQVLGADEARKLARLDPDGWYPIEWMHKLTDQMERELGYYGLLRMGRTLFETSHKERTANEIRSARDLVHALDGMYRTKNRGSCIGGWKVCKFDAGYVELEKTTPHHCVMEQGLVTAALASVGCPGIVNQTECFRQGGDACLFVITSSVTDERWFGSGDETRPSGSRPASTPPSTPGIAELRRRG
jgi:hypothetical protein